MAIPAKPGPGQNRLILAGTGILTGIPVDPQCYAYTLVQGMMQSSAIALLFLI